MTKLVRSLTLVSEFIGLVLVLGGLMAAGDMLFRRPSKMRGRSKASRRIRRGLHVRSVAA